MKTGIFSHARRGVALAVSGCKNLDEFRRERPENRPEIHGRRPARHHGQELGNKVSIVGVNRR